MSKMYIHILFSSPNNKLSSLGNEKEKKKEKKPPAETKAAILQSLRTKLNNLIQEDGKFYGWLYTI